MIYLNGTTHTVTNTATNFKYQISIESGSKWYVYNRFSSKWFLVRAYILCTMKTSKHLLIQPINRR